MMIKKTSRRRVKSAFRKTVGASNGFTFVELMVGMAVTAIVAGTIMGGYLQISRLFKDQRDVAVMQMNQRGTVENMELEFRMVGYDPERAGLFGVADVRRYSVTNEVTVPVPDPNGSPAVTIVYDDYISGPADGQLNVTDTRISYRMFDEGGDNNIDLADRRELARDTETGNKTVFTLPREILAENIQDIGFAYAIDTDGDKKLDRAAGGNIIWAVDSDNDNVLDANVDANGDGVIDDSDDTDNDFVIGSADQTPLGAIPGGTAPLTSIRAVRIWVLARAPEPTKNYENKEVYVVGDRRLTADATKKAVPDFSNNIKCRLMVRSIECRNLSAN